MIFHMDGSFPISWEDFLGDDNKTNVTINTHSRNEGIEIGKDGWIDIYVKDEFITLERAIDILGVVVDGPISIVCNNNTQTI